MRFVVEYFVAIPFCVLTFANIQRGLNAWERWVESTALEWKNEYTWRYCARVHAAERNFAAARDFWFSRSIDASGPFQKAWDEWQRKLEPYEKVSPRCDEHPLIATHEENPAVSPQYPNWVMRYAAY